MRFTKILSKKSFAIYGLGVTGKSVVKYLKKKKVKNLFIWDDTKKIQKKYKLSPSIKTFSNSLNFVDYIILSPGININKSKIKKKLIKNKQKIITDIDLFYMSNDNIKSIVVTGSNGKSTTCKLIEHILKKSKFKTQIGGNIGKPILSLKKAKKNIFIIEASSFQLAYSKYIKPTYAIMLNISRDHLDWHRTVQNYINAKFKIFSLQDKKDYSFLLDSKLLRLYKKRKFLGKLKTIKLKSFKSIKHKIKNKYLISKINEENMSFVYELSKLLKIQKNNFISQANTFKGLPHRFEFFYQKKSIKFINDSKATSFEASKLGLQTNKNILWIVGGLPKLKDNFNLNVIKSNVIKSYIIGNHVNFFAKKFKNKIKFKITKNLKSSLIAIITDIRKYPDKKFTVLFSPASASFDQFQNFVDRGNKFKKIAKTYAKKYL